MIVKLGAASLWNSRVAVPANGTGCTGARPGLGVYIGLKRADDTTPCRASVVSGQHARRCLNALNYSLHGTRKTSRSLSPLLLSHSLSLSFSFCDQPSGGWSDCAPSTGPATSCLDAPPNECRPDHRDYPKNSPRSSTAALRDANSVVRASGTHMEPRGKVMVHLAEEYRRLATGVNIFVARLSSTLWNMENTALLPVIDSRWSWRSFHVATVRAPMSD